MEKEVGEPMNMGSVLPVGGAPISDLDHKIEQGLFVFASIDILREYFALISGERQTHMDRS
jgi:hypothetical protein